MTDQQIVSVGTLIEERFKIVREIGRGGMGVVYEAEHTITGKRLAVKVMGKELSADSQYKQRFLREAKLMAQMNHPTIATVDSVGIRDDRLYLVMEYVDGRTLQQELSRGPISEQDAYKIAMQICDALEHAHALGIVHRDLKPSNIILKGTTSCDSLKLLDFGIAGWLDREKDGQITRTGQVFGSPDYMSPEQAQGMAADGRSDLYSLGCIMYEMLSGKPPFSGGSFYEVLSKQMQEPPPPLKGVSPEWQQIILAALNKHPVHRYQNARELHDDLQLAASGKAIKVHKAPGDASKWPWPRKEIPATPGGHWVSIMLIIIGALIVTTFLISREPESTGPAAPLQPARDRAQEFADELNGEDEAKDLLFTERKRSTTLPHHKAAQMLMERRWQLPPADPQRDVILLQTLDLLRRELKSPEGSKVSTTERALMLNRLAAWDALSLPQAPDFESKNKLYKEALNALKEAGPLDEQLQPGYAKSFRPTHMLAFLNWQFARALANEGVMLKSIDGYREVGQLLKQKISDGVVSKDEHTIYTRSLSRITHGQDLIIKWRKGSL